MCHRIHSTQRSVLFALAVLVLCAGALPAAAEDAPARVLILPFAIHAEKELAYLREGIADMLSTRLSVEGKTVMADPVAAGVDTADVSDFDVPQAAAVGRQAGVDYVVFGSLTVIFDRLSTDIRLVDVQTGKSRVTFNQTGDDLGDVIGHIDLFTQQAKQNLLGEKAVAAAPPETPQPKPGAEPQSQPSKKPTKPAAATPVIVTPAEESAVGSAESLWRSKRFHVELAGVDIGDVDGDGQAETVFIGSQVVYIYRLEANGRFRSLAKIENKGFNRHIHVGVADINANGVAEIFVSNMIGAADPPASFVLEWNGRRFARIAENIPWYYRVIKDDAGPKLYGQRRTRDELFQSGIFEMNWAGGSYEPGRRLPLPYNVNVYAFTYGDLLNDGGKAFFAFKRSTVPFVYDAAGTQLWKGPDSFGGTGIYIEYRPSRIGGDRSEEPSDTSYYYLPNPAVVTDTDGDGFNEVLTVNNELGLTNILARIRSYKKGNVVSLDWNGSGLQKRWQTIDFTKFITGLAVGDFNNDGTDEIVFTVVSKTRSVLSGAKSYVGAINVRREAATGTGG